MLELGAGTGLFRVQDLGRQHAVADHRPRGGADAVRRLARQRRRPQDRLPALERAHALDGEQAAAVGVHLGCRGAHPVPPDAVAPFTFKRVEGLRPAIQQVTDECIDAILAGPQPADIVTQLALPVPTEVISEMLGVPYEDHEFFQHHANVGLARYASAEDGQKGAMSLHKYLIDLVTKKMENPAEDAVSDLAERVTAGEISVKEAAQLGTGLLIAGHETTANMIGIGVLALLQNPEQAALLRDTDDPKLIANAVEELMRYLSIIQNGQRRIATEDIEISGETIRAGDGIIIDLAPGQLGCHVLPGAGAPGPAAGERRPGGRLRLRPAPVRRPTVGSRRDANRVSHPAAPDSDDDVGHSVRRGAVQARPVGLRRLQPAGHLVTGSAG